MGRRRGKRKNVGRIHPTQAYARRPRKGPNPRVSQILIIKILKVEMSEVPLHNLNVVPIQISLYMSLRIPLPSSLQLLHLNTFCFCCCCPFLKVEFSIAATQSRLSPWPLPQSHRERTPGYTYTWGMPVTEGTGDVCVDAVAAAVAFGGAVAVYLSLLLL